MTDALLAASTMPLTDSGRAKPSKFNSRVTYVGSLRFHSAAEARRWQELCLLERAGSISGLRRQVPFKLMAWSVDGPVQIGTYKADFQYRDLKTNQEVVEDKKGARTAHYARTAKIMLANYNITILET